MSILSRLPSVLTRLRENVLFIGLVFAPWLLDLLEPLSRFEGWLLIMYGALIAHLDYRFNPHREAQQAGPNLRWDEMHAGDRLEYFFLALFFAVPAILVLIVAALSSGSITDKWEPLAFAVFWVGVGAWIAYDKWRNRWGAVEAE